MRMPARSKPAPCQPIPILAYHQIAPEPARDVPHREYVISREAFARQMGMLHALGWRGLSMTQLEPYLTGEQRGKVFGLTFDDGYLDCHEKALPVLERLGFRATCYAVSAQVGGTNAWDVPQGVPEHKLMDAAQLRAWVAAGNEVGAHTRHHVSLPHVSHQVARDEIIGARHELEDLLGTPVLHFCYPYGRFEPAHLALVREAGYRSGTSCIGRRTYEGAHWMALPRFVMTSHMSLPGLWRRLAWGTERVRSMLRAADYATIPAAAGIAFQDSAAMVEEVSRLF